jgi:hypothetical protein
MMGFSSALRSKATMHIASFLVISGPVWKHYFALGFMIGTWQAG